MTLADVAHIATIAGVVVGIVALVYTAIQVHLSRKANQTNLRVNQATFWLELERMFSKHDEVHTKLRPGGEWSFLIGLESKGDLQENRISGELRREFEKTKAILPQNAAVLVQDNGWLIVDEKKKPTYFIRKKGKKLNVTIHYLTVREWASVEDYMGLFEHCKIMLDKEMLDWNTFMKIFAYRVGNLLNNRFIVKAKLVEKAAWWVDFIALIGELGRREPEKWKERLKEVKEWGAKIPY